MIRIAGCGTIDLKEGDLPSSLARCAARQGVKAYSLDEYANPIDLVDACSKALMEAPYDLVVCAVDLMGVSGVQVTSDLNSLHSFADDLRVVLCSPDAERAYDAAQLGVDGYLVEPVEQSDFDRVIGHQLQSIKIMHADSVVLRCRDRMRRIAFSRLSYAETSAHDQILHHVGNSRTCEMRGSSNDLFALLEGDDRFFKVGSSYIVNLDYVQRFESRSGTIVLSDGLKIPIPVRLRKPLVEALCVRGAISA